MDNEEIKSTNYKTTTVEAKKSSQGSVKGHGSNADKSQSNKNGVLSGAQSVQDNEAVEEKEADQEQD
jgi:hypothetical protein